jgi:hypothetical protein
MVEVTQGGKFFLLRHSLKGADEGRGVALFDNFTALNAQRVAQELLRLSPPSNPRGVDIRYVALAIAKDCITDTTDATLGQYAPPKARAKFLGDHRVRNFNALLRDTDKRRKSLPRLKANMQAANLVSLIEANCAAEKTPKCDTTGATITREIARRSTANLFPPPAGTCPTDDCLFVTDTLTRFMIDREGARQLKDSPDQMETLQIALYRFFLEPVGVDVNNWSMSVNSEEARSPYHGAPYDMRSETYTFGDLFRAEYIPEIQRVLTQALQGTDTSCAGLAKASLEAFKNVK